jgi:hypothetical protein
LRIARSSAVKARTQAANQIRDLITTGPDDLRDRLRGQSTIQRVEACARLRITDRLSISEQATRTALRTLARRHKALTIEVNDLTERIDKLVTVSAPTLTSLRESAPTSLPSCSSQQATTPTESATKPPSLHSAEHHRWMPPQANSNATVSTVEETDKPTTPSGGSPWSG